MSPSIPEERANANILRHFSLTTRHHPPLGRWCGLLYGAMLRNYDQIKGIQITGMSTRGNKSFAREIPMLRATLISMALFCAAQFGFAEAADRFPGAHWPEASPGSQGLDEGLLRQVSEYLGGLGCIVRHGRMVHAWGDASRRGDVASAAKPWYTTLLMLAVEEGLLESADTPVARFVPELETLNPDLDHKDRAMTFAHMANQTSCYGVSERPGDAYDYNDYQMALFIDTLFLKVYGAGWDTVDRDVLGARLADAIGCEDSPTLLAFGTEDRPGRVGVSPRDFARLGWLMLNGGAWNGRRVLAPETVRILTTSPLPNSIPRTAATEAEMLDGQRSLGSWDIPDDQTDHHGSYSWAWWVNGVDREGRRFWPDAPLDVFTALGHKNGQRGMAAIPSLDLVISWNDTSLGDRPGEPHPLNEVFRLLREAAKDGPMAGQIVADPDNPAWLVRHGDPDRRPFLMCGPGDPEGFLYRGARREDGTRDGDQEAIIDKMRGTGANCLYFQVIRSHGGDGDGTHNPFIDSDPAKGFDERILQQWEGWFKAMDDAGIVIFLFVYDDSASIWNTGDAVGEEERAFLATLARRFGHHNNLVWCVAEEYEERFSPERVKAIARVLREEDKHDHVISVHQLDGLDFTAFADDPVIGQFAMQYNRSDPNELHAGVVTAWSDARGRYNLNLSEVYEHGFGFEARRKNWAAALGGAHAMALWWTFDEPDKPSREDLEACGHLVRFMGKAATTLMAPCSGQARGGTACVLGEPGQGYIAYGPDARTAMGIADLPAGTYALTWLDPATGVEVEAQPVVVSDPEGSFTPPASFREDAVLWLRREGEQAASASDLGTHEVTMWAPFLEWSLDNTSYEGNPFDLEATATFTHADTGTTRTTGMFYAGEGVWKFRFTGTREGAWTFTTGSADPELDGHTGSVNVLPNPDPKARGFLTHVKNRFAIMGRDEDDLRPHLFAVYMNNNLYHREVRELADPALVTALLDDAEAHGFDTIFAFICNNWLQLGALAHDEHDSVDPDLETFGIIERMIVQAHARGMRWHLWAWGDESRRWTPIGLPGGVNGPVDRRLQRYMAARLGPLPGWTMGYGFDLIEWTTPEGRNGWASFLHNQMGWDHMLSARGFRLDGTHNNIVSYSSYGGGDLSTTRGGPGDFQEVVAHFDASPESPSFYEERHSHLREGFHLDMDGTRRLRWWQAMAGGVGGFNGFYKDSPHPYPNPEQLRTFRRFWDGRFRLDFERAPDITDGACLKSAYSTYYVLYSEDADAIRADLSGAPHPVTVTAVDTRAEYAETALGTLGPGAHTIRLPHVSDWAIVLESDASRSARHPLVQNGWLVHDGRLVWGWVQHNGWWRPGQRPNLTRRSVGDPEGDVRPNRTEDFDLLTDNMLRHAYPGFEHNYGLWYDRRRDAHDDAHREDANVVPPFLEQPWARGEEGRAADGLPKYDLTRFNPWYFDRLREFAGLCDQKGTVLFHKFHMQHNMLETPAHYVDYPWRPFNCIQDTALPDTIPAANAFYDMDNPVRRDLQRLYIRHCLDTLGDSRNVVHLTAEEYTGPLPFVQFWMDTIAEWERETGKDVCVGLGAPKDVQDAILADPARGPRVDVIDLRCWWYRADGSLNALEGGREIPGRGIESGSQQGEETSPAQIYRKIREYRDQYPDKAIIDAIDGGRIEHWAFFMGGGSLLVRGQLEYANQADPPAYEAPEGTELIVPSYAFLRDTLGVRGPALRPADIVAPGGATAWCLAIPGELCLVYAPSGGVFNLRLDAFPGACTARWFNPETGELTADPAGEAEGGGTRRFSCPDDNQDWVLLLEWTKA
jgi:hypothetical protein